MANDVETLVCFHQLSPAGEQRLQELYRRVQPETTDWGGTYEWFSHLWVDGQPGSPTYDEPGDRFWAEEVIGSKWCYFRERDRTSFELVSAWDPPLPGLEWLLAQLVAVDPQLLVSVAYRDEMPNFHGARVYRGCTCLADLHEDEDQIRAQVCAAVPALAQQQGDEANSRFQDEVWSVLDARQQQFLEQVLAQAMPDPEPQPAQPGLLRRLARRSRGAVRRLKAAWSDPQPDTAVPEVAPPPAVDPPVIIPEVTEAEATAVPTSLDQLMPQLGFRYREDDERFLLSFSTEHYRDREDDHSVQLSVRDFPKASLLSVDAHWLYTVPETCRDCFAEAALLVQWRVKFLRYELDDSDGEVRACIELPYSEEQFITRQQLRRALTALVGLVDEYDAFLRTVIDTNRLDLSQLP